MQAILAPSYDAEKLADGHSVKSLYERRMLPVYYSSVQATFELMIIRHILFVPNISADNINTLLCAECTN